MGTAIWARQLLPGLLRGGQRRANSVGVGHWRQDGEPAIDRRRGVRAMRIAPLTDVKARLSAYVEQAGTDGPIVITHKCCGSWADGFSADVLA